MSISIKSRIVIMDTSMWEPIYLETLDIDKVEEYMDENPFPFDENYSEDDLMGDIENGYNVFILPDGIKDTTARYIEELISYSL